MWRQVCNLPIPPGGNRQVANLPPRQAATDSTSEDDPTMHPKLEEMVRRDPRYPLEAYEFVFAALTHTQRQLGRNPSPEPGHEDEHHVSGQQLLEGIRDLALREFGLLARTVLRLWGINR